MAFTTVILQRPDPIVCGPNAAEMQPGDTARLFLDTDSVPDLPDQIIGVVQTPVLQVKVFNPTTNCVVIGRQYTIGYESDDLEGALTDLRPDDILEIGCVSCCQLLDERLATEIAARIAGDTPLELTAPPVNGVEGTVAEGFLSFTGLPNPGETFTINGRVYTFRAAGPLGASQVLIGANITDLALNIKTALINPPVGSINAHVTVTLITPGLVPVHALAVGTAGNSITLSESASNLTVSGPTLTGGTPSFPGTIGLKNQSAFVRTTNASGSFVDIWTCVGVAPSRWQPPSGLQVKRPEGTLMRSFIGADNSFSWELAYV